MIEKIKNVFRKNGYDYKLIARNGMVAMYAQMTNGVIGAYEVHKIRVKKASKAIYHQIGKEPVEIMRPEQEILAGNGEFGMYGWGFQTKTDAITKYEELGGKYVE